MAKKKASRNPEKSTESAIDLAAPVTGQVRLQEILIEELHVNRSPDAVDSPKNVRLRMRTSEYEVGRSTEESDLNFHVGIKFDLEISRKESLPDQPLVKISCKYVLVYSVESFENVKQENLIAFAETSGLYNAWPYWRELVQNLSYRLSIPPILIPTYRAKNQSIGKNNAESKK